VGPNTEFQRLWYRVGKEQISRVRTVQAYNVSVGIIQTGLGCVVSEYAGPARAIDVVNILYAIVLLEKCLESRCIDQNLTTRFLATIEHCRYTFADSLVLSLHHSMVGHRLLE
jgi:hypothetical protein